MTALLEVLDVERLDEDLFRGRAARTTLTRTFGGQVAGQSLVAAVRTVPKELSVHSLHGYFIRPGDPFAPTILEVDRVRDGRTFATRRVSAIQEGKAIFTMSASFQGQDVGPEHQEGAPDVPDPEELEESARQDREFQDVHLAEWPDWQLRRVAHDPSTLTQQVWLRHATALPDDPVLHACALAYASDMTLLSCARRLHPGARVQMASLDHAVWFHRPFLADDWLLYDQRSPSGGFGRTICHGRIFDRSGRLVATVVQEGLMRTLIG